MNPAPTEVIHDLTAAAAKTAPATYVLAMSLNDWVAAFAMVWTVLQRAYLIWKWRREWHAK